MMQDEDRTREQLIHEVRDLRKRVAAMEASEAEHKEIIELSIRRLILCGSATFP